MKILSVENISKAYGEKALFENLSFTISEKERVGLIGVNGTGKSSLLKIIADLDTAEKGKIIHPNDYKIVYLPQNPAFDNKLTVLEHVYYGDSPLMQLFREYEMVLTKLNLDPSNQKIQNHLYELQQRMDAMDAWDANTQAKSILNRLGIENMYLKVGELSGGQRKRIAIASALIQTGDLLILDEPTNHIDYETIEWFEAVLSQYNGAILLVTHDRYFLNRITNKIIELDNGQIYSYNGNYEIYLEKKAERDELLRSLESKRQNILRRELEWLQRGAKARTTKQKARKERVESLQNQRITTTKDELDIALGAARLGKKVIEVNQITKSFANQVIIKDFNLLCLPYERIGIIGPNGSGKTTLLNLLTGKLPVDKGSIEIGETVRFAYYTQENLEMPEDIRIIDYIKKEAEIIHTSDGKTLNASQMLERFMFTPNMQWSPIKKLSGGERKRLNLLRILMGQPNVLIFDEPTNDLDIQTLSILEDYLEHFPGVVIIVSHDRYFLDRTVNKILAFEGKGKIATFYGNYSEYLELITKEKEKAAPSKNNKEASGKESHLPRKLSYNQQKEWDEIEERIAALEEQLKQIQLDISTVGSDYLKAQELSAQENILSDELDKLIERWTELSEIIENINYQKNLK